MYIESEAEPGVSPQEQEPTLEIERPEPSSRIELHFFRHSEKENAPPGTPDEEVLLTPRGRTMSLEAHQRIAAPEGSSEQAVAIGSSRKRTQETAAFVLGGPELLTGDETLEELRAKLDGGRRYGSKLGVDRRLDFSRGEVPEYTTEYLAEFKAGRLIPWLAEHSDRRAMELGDTSASTFDRSAGKIAEIIEKYVTIAPRFDELVRTKGYAPQMERFLGTHMSIPEPFLLKLVGQLRGTEERERLLGMLSKGLDPIEGFNLEIKNFPDNEQPSVEVRFAKRDPKTGEEYRIDQAVPLEVLQQFIAEGNASVEAAKGSVGKPTQ